LYVEAGRCERSMFHAVHRMQKQLRNASLKPSADVSSLITVVQVMHAA